MVFTSMTQRLKFPLSYVPNFFNALSYLVGAFILSFGIWLFKWMPVSICLRVSGLGLAIVIVCLSLFGLFDSFKKVKWFFIILSSIYLVYTLALTGLITFKVHKANIDGSIKKTMISSLQNRYSENRTERGSDKWIWDFFQRKMHCCGLSVDGHAPYYAWQTSKWFHESNRSPGLVPTSCCVLAPHDDALNVTFLDRAKCLAIDNYAKFFGPPRSRYIFKSFRKSDFSQDLWDILEKLQKLQKTNDALFVDDCYVAFRGLLNQTLIIVMLICFVAMVLLLEVITLCLAKPKDSEWEKSVDKFLDRVLAR